MDMNLEMLEKDLKRKRLKQVNKNINKVTLLLLIYSFGMVTEDLFSIMKYGKAVIEQQMSVTTLLTKEIPIANDKIDINNQVTIRLKTHFNFAEEPMIKNAHASKWSSFSIFDSRFGKFLFIGIDNITSIEYDAILTHEYAHNILHQYGLTNDKLQEALADVITLYLSPEGQKILMGENNELRQGTKYGMITNDVIWERRECLNQVFENQIDTADEILENLKDYCNVDLVNDIINKL